MAAVLVESRNTVSAQLVRNPLIHQHFYRAGADRPNNGVATARQTYGVVFAIAPGSSNNPPPAQPRDN